MAGFLSLAAVILRSPSGDEALLGTAARVGMLADVLGATLVLTPGVGTTAFIGRRLGALPAWLGWLGVATAIVWGLHVALLATPWRGATVFGAPMGMLWIIGTAVTAVWAGRAPH